MFELPTQTNVLPVMFPGTATSTNTFNVCAADEQIELFAVTEIVPLVVLAVVLIVALVDVPIHPPGKVHV